MGTLAAAPHPGLLLLLLPTPTLACCCCCCPHLAVGHHPHLPHVVLEVRVQVHVAAHSIGQTRQRLHSARSSSRGKLSVNPNTKTPKQGNFRVVGGYSRHDCQPTTKTGAAQGPPPPQKAPHTCMNSPYLEL